MGYGFYLYGIFPAPGPQGLNLVGLDQQTVGSQDVDEFTFLYSEAQQDRYLASRKNLLGHEKVLEQAMQAGYCTLLPLQFGLIIESWDAVRQQLTQPYQHQLKRLFQKLQGQREVGIKIFWTQDVELQALMAENQTLQSQRSNLEGKNLRMDEVVAIGQAIEHAMDQRKQAIIDAFRQTLNPLATEIVENESLTDAMIYNSAYLIPWDKEPEFGQLVEVLDQQFDQRLKIRYNNWTAPYNFANLNALD